MSDAARLQASTAVHEGFEAVPYPDTQKLWTFGRGRCLETHPLSAAEWKYLLDAQLIKVEIAQAGADWLMKMELYSVEIWFAKTFAWWPRLNDARQNALIEMGFQLGIGKVPLFHNLLTAIAAEDWDTAEHEVLFSSKGDKSPWDQETPVRAEAVARMLKTGAFV